MPDHHPDHWPIYLQVFNQSYKILAADSVLIIEHGVKIQHSRAHGLIDAILADLNSGVEHVTIISRLHFVGIYLETDAALKHICNE